MMFDKEHMAAMGRPEHSALGASIDSDKHATGAPGDLLSYVFQVLYENQDIELVIQLILEIVGKRFDVSRAYVFENFDDGKYCNNTYEWCNEGITLQKEYLQHFPYEQAEGYRDLFNNGSIFYCKDIHSLTLEQRAIFDRQGVCAILQCALL